MPTLFWALGILGAGTAICLVGGKNFRRYKRAGRRFKRGWQTRHVRHAKRVSRKADARKRNANGRLIVRQARLSKPTRAGSVLAVAEKAAGRKMPGNCTPRCWISKHLPESKRGSKCECPCQGKHHGTGPGGCRPSAPSKTRPAPVSQTPSTRPQTGVRRAPAKRQTTTATTRKPARKAPAKRPTNTRPKTRV